MSVRIDAASMLCDAGGEMSLGDVQAQLETENLTLGLDPASWEGVSTLSVNEWLGKGAHGARDPWLDPADHLIAGMEAELLDGRVIVLRPAPRRAVGPDLVSLVVGHAQRFAKVNRVWLRIHVRGARVPETAPYLGNRDPPVTDAEDALLARIAVEMQRPR